MSKIYKQPPHCKGGDDHQKYLSRITKTLYYGKLPKTDMLSFPTTELAVEIFSEAQKGKSLNCLTLYTAAQISRNACVSPCSLVLAMLYLERLKKCNMDYVDKTTPSDLFLVSLMVSSKFLFDDGEIDEVFMDEWAASSGLTCKELIQLERDFLKAINWELYSSKGTFWDKLNDIEISLALKQGTLRGYFTYTEMGVLLYKDIHEVAQCILALSAILAAAYATAVLMLVGSVALASTIPGTSLYYNRISNSATLPFAYQAQKVETSAVNQTTKMAPPKCHNTLNSNALKVLKASILLASIKTQGPSNSTSELDQQPLDTSTQSVSWDWWNVPIMNWLSKSAQLIKSFEMPVIQNCLSYLDVAMVSEKFIYLEDHIHKATKTRIQDQLERSWHAEWTDTIKGQLAYYVLPETC
ncbi:protein CNPPD1 [Euwallacea fornicatus]|uniref:protein CNPPD1 n=1 Tax=Euwallacea fornicatus TaxID=995702 RepID=UPI0033904921